MMALDEAKSRYTALIEQSRSMLPARRLGWLERTRDRAAQRFATAGFPTRKQEAWRYTGIDKLLGHELAPALEPVTALQREDLDEFELIDGAYRLVIANGCLAPGHTSAAGLPDGVVLMGLAEALVAAPELVEPWLGRVAGEGGHAFNEINCAMINDGAFVYVPDGVRLETPVEFVHANIGLDTHFVAQPRNLVVLGRNASATLVERHIGLGDSTYFHNGLSEIVLGDGAALEHYSLQEQSPSAWHLASQFLRQDAGSRYRGTHLMMGGQWSRADLNVEFAGEHAQCAMNGLYLAGDRQLVDMHLNVQHQVPNCASNHAFRGILHGKGRGVFDGRILVAKDAQKTDAHLHNANLLLTRDAEIDTKPQLEIYADDVKCSHGTTVGELDAQQVFYLRSRGISEQQARNMLCQGFAAEILDGCNIGVVGKRLERALARRLANGA